MSEGLDKKIDEILSKAVQVAPTRPREGTWNVVMGDVHVHAVREQPEAPRRAARSSSRLQSLLVQLADLNGSQLRQVCSYVAYLRTGAQ